MTVAPDSRNRVYTVIGIALALFLGALDQTIVSTALPKIVADLGGLDRYTWVTTAYLLVSTLLVPLYGKLADRMDRRRLELFSVSFFIGASALCGLAGEWGALPLIGDGLNQLVLFRALQGLGGAGLFALAFIIISDLYPPRDRGKIGGLFGAIFGLSSVLGPLIGGLLTDHVGWRWVFYVNLPLGIVALAFLIGKMPMLPGKGLQKGVDWKSFVLMMAAFFPLILGLQLDKAQHAWLSPEVLLLIATAVIFGVFWIVYSLRWSPSPVLDLRLFDNKVFRMGVLASFFFGAGFLTMLIFLPLYMMNVQGVSATAAGISIIPLTLGIIVGAGISGPLTTRLGRYRGVLITGSMITFVGGILLVGLGASTASWYVLLAMVVTGIGLGPAQSLYSVAVQNAVQVQELGQATSFAQFSRQIGSTVGAAVAGALFSASIVSAMGMGTTNHTPSTSELRHGSPEITQRIGSRFDAAEAQIETLFSLRGEEAETALRRILVTPGLPADLRKRLEKGTPALQIEKSMTSLERTLEPLVLASDQDGLRKLFASDQGRVLPEPSTKAILQDASLGSRAARQASLTEIRNQMALGMERAIEGSSFVALAVIKAQLKKAKNEAIRTATAKIASAFADAVRSVWLFNVVVLGFLVVTTVFLPGLPLRGRESSDDPSSSS